MTSAIEGIQLVALRSEVDHARGCLAAVRRSRNKSLADEFQGALAALRRAFIAVRNRIVEANLGLAYWAARRSRRTGIDYEDRVISAAIALTKAVDSWDPRIASLSTYAQTPMYRMIDRSIDDMPVKIPIYVKKVTRKIGEARQRLGDDAGYEAVAETAEVSPVTVRRLLDMPPQRFGRLTECLFPGSTKDPEAALMDRDTATLLAPLLKNLTDRERRILKLRFWENMTLAEIGEELGVSRERIRQLERDALAKLRDGWLVADVD
jgi:RNA polymerase nonessential primary-like sigma factor